MVVSLSWLKFELDRFEFEFELAWLGEGSDHPFVFSKKWGALGESVCGGGPCALNR